MTETMKEKNYKGYIQQFREKHIPKRYNQVYLLDELNNPTIDHFLSISNRTDGKSFNYIHALIDISIKYDVGLSFFSRNMMLRTSYQTLINEILEKSAIYERKDFNFIRQQYFTQLNYKDTTIAIISDLNNATELKYFSNFIKKFPIMIYDEFIALEGDYLGDEWQRLKTIYESIDREEEYPLIKKPKIFYFGNAVNFESPVLFGLKIFNILEKHPINTRRIYKYDYNIMLEMHRNDNANEQRNTRAFGGSNDAMTTAEFESNDFRLATDDDRNEIRKNPRIIYVKLRDDFLKIWFNRDTMKIILSIESFIQDDYLFNLRLKDNREHSEFLNNRYFSDNHIKKIDKGYYLFDNNYSKNKITNDYLQLNELRIDKIIRTFLKEENDKTERENKEKQFEENYVEQTKKGLMQKLWG